MVRALLQQGANVNAADNEVRQYKMLKVPLNNAVFLMRHASRAKAISIRFALEETC